tara:strand:- start:38 stop:346 length:309 start_codon:yes stop_codon:yes gene_type:complete
MMSKKQSVGASVTLFMEEVYEIAFGADAIKKDFYTFDEVLAKLREFCDAHTLWHAKEYGLVDKDITQLVSNVFQDDLHRGAELTQEEVDTLLTDKIGGMFND